MNLAQKRREVPRLPKIQMDLIRKEFEKNTGKHRQIKILDFMLHKLKFFSRYSEKDRHIVLKKA